jgi:hypothetical protein
MYFLVIINKLYIKYENHIMCRRNNKRGLWDSYTYYIVGSDKEAKNIKRKCRGRNLWKRYLLWGS